MRITNNIIQQTSLANVQKNLRELYRTQEQVTSGRSFNRASDDPVSASASMETRSSIRSLQQYRRGIDIANSRAAAEEAVLDQLLDIVVRAKELGVTYASDGVTDLQRATAGAEVESLLREVVSLANTPYGEGYLFGGAGPNTVPYATAVVAGNLDFTSTTPSGTFQIQISSHHSVPANHNSVEVFEDSGLMAALRDMAIAMKSGDRQEIADSIPDVDSAFAAVQNLLGSVGARSSALQITAANVGALEAGLLILKSDVEDADLEKAITELMSRQTTYQAALMTTSRIVGMTLADYLR
ncbi:MAG TPA: flagellar hook-associated protein FlgL [Longimicrobiaceae bacterium]|nr:flagellar hook-associated protein FlgL [Longimicrobiaceae bacterium]